MTELYDEEDWVDEDWVGEELARTEFDLDELLELRRERYRGAWAEDYDWGDE